MFRVDNHLAKIVSVTNVSEKHGKERKPALSIGLYIVGPSSWLGDLDPMLRPTLFRKPMASPGDLPLEFGADDLTELRFPFMRNLQWSRDYGGYLLRFLIGASGKEDVLLSDVGIKGIYFVPQEGGSCGYGFKCKAHPLTELDHGKVAARLQQECIITLTPPEQYAEPGLFSDDEDRSPSSSDSFAGTDIPPLAEQEAEETE